jgi:ribosomal protein S27E
MHIVFDDQQYFISCHQYGAIILDPLWTMFDRAGD